MDAIFSRRSIRKYKPTPLAKDAIQKIILAGMQAPSAKNRQPWRFIVVEGPARQDMVHAMEKGLERERQNPLLARSTQYIAAAQNTIRAMEQAPITIFVINPFDSMQGFPKDWETRFYETANIQSVGACIQNMLLCATQLGIGSLWNCDIYFAYNEIAAWLNTRQQIVAAVSFGLADENPGARPRSRLEDLVEWKT